MNSGRAKLQVNLFEEPLQNIHLNRILNDLLFLAFVPVGELGLSYAPLSQSDVRQTRRKQFLEM